MGELPPQAVSMREAARGAVRDALWWALVTLGLCFPIILLRTEQDLSNRIVLNLRPWLTLGLVLAVFLGRILWLLAAHAPRPKTLPFPRLDLYAKSPTSPTSKSSD